MTIPSVLNINYKNNFLRTDVTSFKKMDDAAYISNKTDL